MTVSYSYEASTATSFTFLRLMTYWHGSIWKLIYRELIIWTILYYCIAFIKYTAAGTVFEASVERFIEWNVLMKRSTECIMILSFFTSLAVGRFFSVYTMIWWPDNCAIAVAGYLKSTLQNEAEMRVVRKTCARYIMLCFILVMRDVSAPIKKRFPTLEMLTQYAGLMTKQELQFIEGSVSTAKYWIPIEWMLNLLKRYYIKYPGCMDQYAYNDLVNEMVLYRTQISNIYAFDWVPIPLAYTQLTIFSAYSTAFTMLFTSQTVSNQKEISYYYYFVKPFIFSFMELCIIIGWLKIAATMLNPFGPDDDDFEVSWLIDRHWVAVSEILEHPISSVPNERITDLIGKLPHTKASRAFLHKNKHNPMIGSVANVKVNREDAELVDVAECEDSDNLNASMSSSPHLSPKPSPPININFIKPLTEFLGNKTPSLKKTAPAPAPTLAPAPAAAPTLAPAPAPAPTLAPALTPAPAPISTTTVAPTQAPTAAPTPVPAPTTAPVPSPTPLPAPRIAPAPSPTPANNATPAPAPNNT